MNRRLNNIIYMQDVNVLRSLLSNEKYIGTFTCINFLRIANSFNLSGTSVYSFPGNLLGTMRTHYEITSTCTPLIYT